MQAVSRASGTLGRRYWGLSCFATRPGKASTLVRGPRRLIVSGLRSEFSLRARKPLAVNRRLPYAGRGQCCDDCSFAWWRWFSAGPWGVERVEMHPILRKREADGEGWGGLRVPLRANLRAPRRSNTIWVLTLWSTHEEHAAVTGVRPNPKSKRARDRRKSESLDS